MFANGDNPMDVTLSFRSSIAESLHYMFKAFKGNETKQHGEHNSCFLLDINASVKDHRGQKKESSHSEIQHIRSHHKQVLQGHRSYKA